MLYGGSALVEAGAQPNGQADVLGLESNEWTSVAVVLTVFLGLRRYLVGYGCTTGADGVVERVSGWPLSLSSYWGLVVIGFEFNVADVSYFLDRSDKEI